MPTARTRRSSRLARASSTWCRTRRQSRVSCSPTSRAIAATGIAAARVSTKASKLNVNPLPGRAHGTATGCTPQRGHATRGTRATSSVRYWKKLRWRQRRSSVSWAGQSVRSHVGQGKRPPRRKSIAMVSCSASRSTWATYQGAARPRAAAKSSGVSIPAPYPPHGGHARGPVAMAGLCLTHPCQTARSP